MLFATAFLLGLVGGLHCAGMCGPLVLALPAGHPRFALLLRDRVLYNVGRVSTYVLLGLLFGLLGEWFAVAGWQRWVSIAAGAAILVGWLASSRFNLGLPALSLVARLRPWFGALLSKRQPAAQLGLGALNGLLPCGLVYVACAGAAAAGGLGRGALFMTAFGLGTVPVMLGMGLAGARLQTLTRRWGLQRLVPASLLVVAALLILRGMALGIPYLSPGDPADGCPACHQQR